jgi:thymidylate synthase
MLEPLPEIPAVRVLADQLMKTVDYRPIETVRNTIFPAEWAEDIPEPEELARDYLEHYEDIRALDRANRHGTYFGRIVAQPRADGSSGNQLVRTIEKLRDASSGGQRYKTRYEINVYSEEKDANVTRGFPCMTHLAFQVDGDELHCLATYRNHDLIQKAYGNWLALAELQQYVAGASGFVPGELSVLAGHAFIDFSGARLAALEQALEQMREHVS